MNIEKNLIIKNISQRSILATYLNPQALKKRNIQSIFSFGFNLIPKDATLKALMKYLKVWN